MSSRLRWAGAVVPLLALATAAAVAVPAQGVATHSTVAGRTAAVAQTSAQKTDAVPTPALDWYPCLGKAECATVDVPRDYDRPHGATVQLALLRLKARVPARRIGSLFVNPGGPGGSATELAYFSDEVFSSRVLNRFDIVGMDPRGIGFSDNVACFPGAREQAPVLAGYAEAFPMTRKQQRAWLRSDRAEGRACSRTPLARSMSTAEVARDMELVRRAVGDRQLSYFGFSYGTYLGQVYANLYPHRFRAVAVDGVLDPVAWAGDAANRGRPLEQRLRSSRGAWKALHEILVRCDRVGGTRCSFAPGNPLTNLALIARRLKASPLVDVDPFSGEVFRFGYADLVATMLGMLYDPAGYQPITDMLSQLIVLTEPGNPQARATAAQVRRQKAALRRLADLRRQYADLVGRPGFDFPYFNGIDAAASVTCTDSVEDTRGQDFPAYAAQADRSAPYFGRAWTWISSVCAGDAFTGNDEDAYTGPFNRRTTAPVLYVGDYFDPATNYRGAVSAARRMPNSRLLSSNSWGHTAYGTSACVTSAVDRYLVAGRLPATGKVCVGDVQPFDASNGELAANAARQRALRGTLDVPRRVFHPHS
jgi:pimeloyl-ACP methyl ester carboxylesterase